MKIKHSALIITLAFPTSAFAQSIEETESPRAQTSKASPENSSDSRADESPEPQPGEDEADLPPVPSGNGGVAIFPVKGTNLSDGNSDALGVLLAAHFQEHRGGRVLAPESTRDFLILQGDEIVSADTLKVEQYVSVQAVRLKKKIIVTATLYSSEGVTIHSSKMTAKSIDDFESVADRLTRALIEKTSVEETRTLDNITKDESKGSNKIFVEKIFGFKAGILIPYTPRFGLESMVTASFDVRLEGESYFIEAAAGLVLPSSGFDDDSTGYGGVGAEIGASYYLGDGFVAPYAGGGIMPRILSAQAANMAIYGQAGLMFFRQSSSRMYVDFRIAQNLTPLGFNFDSSDPDSFEVNTRKAYPTEFGLHLGVGW